MNNSKIISPCISICKSDPSNGFCYGCARTDEEKKIWKNPNTTNQWKKGNLGICFAANADDAGDGFLKKNSFNLGLSSVIKLSNTSSLSLGFLNTYNQLTIDPSNIMWGSQFNGEYHDPNISSGENFAKNTFGYYNIATGIAFTYGKEEGYMSLYDQTHIQVGLSTYNI